MLPDRCSISESGTRCASPPEFVVSVEASDGEYMVGVTCDRHMQAVSARIHTLQKDSIIPKGRVKFTRLKAVGTDCIRGDADDLVQIKPKN